MPQWIASEIGLALCLVGFLCIVTEWFLTYRAQGNAIARNSLRAYLALWLTTDVPAQHAALARRMRETAHEIRDEHHRNLFTGYINTLETLERDTQTRMVPDMDRAFEVGTELEAQAIQGQRVWLMGGGILLVVLGTLGQMIGSWNPGASG